MQKIELDINNKKYAVDVPEGMPLLWVLRDIIGLTGTKFGCGKGLCGACTVHMDGYAVRSCSLPAETVVGKKITTIEGVVDTHPVKEAWRENNVPQCGYCQCGQIMTAVAFLTENKKPTSKQIDDAMSGNICRCGTYGRIKKAVTQAAQKKS